MSNTIKRALDQATQQVDRLDAQLLLAQILSKPRSFLFSWPDQPLTDAEFDRFVALIEQRAQGTPLAYLTGIKSFWNLDLFVSPEVLIPRPDTELLVELALSYLPPGARVLELATGSGAIACALAHQRRDLSILATDISEAALQMARKNAAQYALDSITFIQSDWFSAIPAERFHLILANPPYLAENDPHLSHEIRYEPRDALVSGPQGDEDYVAILAQAAEYLQPGGVLMFEHGCEQGERLRALFAAQGFSPITTVNDLAGHERVTRGIRPDSIFQAC